MEVGEFRITGSAGEIAQPVYSKLTVAVDLPTTEGGTVECLLSEDPLGGNLYFSVDSFVVSGPGRVRSEMFLSLYEITKVYVDADYRTKAVIRCPGNDPLKFLQRISTCATSSPMRRRSNWKSTATGPSMPKTFRWRFRR